MLRKVFVVEVIQHTRWFPYGVYIYRSQANAFISSMGDLREFYRVVSYEPKAKRKAGR